ncbi:hypothetical protein HYFRA_00010087 [Hymenoscyphus fraxineus]|uniref:Uncharacterized protein n=1 Tax=Hymenoscyphus fraxineus TaxID=746836 RepID=A0A9N9KVG7_9HELO|nr:hypothetical protein HYFRA_00010087 [Hymenoscyphus fraxineus]
MSLDYNLEADANKVFPGVNLVFEKAISKTQSNRRNWLRRFVKAVKLLVEKLVQEDSDGKLKFSIDFSVIKARMNQLYSKHWLPSLMWFAYSHVDFWS